MRDEAKLAEDGKSLIHEKDRKDKNRIYGGSF